MRNQIRLASAVLALAIVGCKHEIPPEAKLTPAPRLLPHIPPAKPMAIDPALQARARREIVEALASSEEVIRAHALETVKLVNLPEGAQQIIIALDDTSPLVRKAAALAAGELRIKEAQDRIEQRIDSAELPERIADIFALHRLGDTRYSHELEKTAVDTRPPVRGDTAMVLGMIADKSAVPILMEMMRHDRSPAVGLQAAEALWKMGEQRGLDELVGATISRYPDDQMVALLALAGPRDTRVLGHVEGLLTEDYPEVQLVAARAAGMLGSDDGYGIAMKGIKSVDPRQRFLAALAFGDIGRADAQPLLAPLLQDDKPDVRLAAAGALVQLGQRGR